jgi:hypothetical protein
MQQLFTAHRMLFSFCLAEYSIKFNLLQITFALIHLLTQHWKHQSQHYGSWWYPLVKNFNWWECVLRMASLLSWCEVSGFLSSGYGIWCHVVWLKFTDILEEHGAAIFMGKVSQGWAQLFFFFLKRRVDFYKTTLCHVPEDSNLLMDTFIASDCISPTESKALLLSDSNI